MEREPEHEAPHIAFASLLPRNNELPFMVLERRHGLPADVASA